MNIVIGGTTGRHVFDSGIKAQSFFRISLHAAFIFSEVLRNGREPRKGEKGSELMRKRRNY